ncbi:MAG: Ig-like domain-containing protein [Eubacterium sp.]|nr:Ig-like domain-containing protein [Eubacterium sp.]
MKIYKKILVIILTVFMVLGNLSVSALADSSKNKVKAIKVSSVPANVLVIKKGQNYKLKVKVSVDGKAGKKVRYFSANENIASVSSSGRVRGIRKGSTKITIKSAVNPKIKKIIKVKVGTPVKKVKVTRKNVTLNEGDSYKIKVNVSPKKATYKKVSYTSSDKTVVKVSKKGKVTALKEGTAVITVKSKDGSNKKTKVAVTVTKPETQPTTDPSMVPSAEPSSDPSVTPTSEVTVGPMATPSVEPTADSAVTPSAEPTASSAVTPGVEPTAPASVSPTATTSSTPTTTASPTPTRNPDYTYMRFDLGGNGTEEGYIGVSAAEAYDKSKGYGFGQLHLVKDVPSSGTGALSDAVHFQGAYGAFSVDLKKGIYKITVSTGDVDSITLKAEDKKQILFMKGNKTESFTIPVTDGQLNIYAESGMGEEHSLCAIEIEQLSTDTVTKPVIWILGDENAAINRKPNETDIRGWGEYLGEYVDTDKYMIRNLAVSSFKSSEIKSYAFDTVEYYGKSGDILLLQSGYSDSDKQAFAANITDIVRRAKDKNISVYLVKMPCTRSDIHRYPVITDKYLNSTLDEIATNEQVGIVDFFSKWFRLILVNYYYNQIDYYSKDEVHLNETGARKYAEMISESLFADTPPIYYGDDIYNFGAAPSAVYETEISGEPISNPHKGFVMTAYAPHYIDSTKGYEYGIGGSLENRAWDCCTIVSGEPKWCELNPEKGVYDWSSIDTMLDKCEEYGLTYGIRILPFSSINDRDFVPEWVYREGAEKQTVKRKDKDEYITFPVWDDPDYIRACKTFATALAKHYDGDPRVEFIDVSVFGDFGEWHNSFAEGDYMPSLDVQKDMLRYYASVFDKTLLAIPSSAIGEIYQYALSLGITKRDNGLICTPNREWSLIPTYEANMPVIGENLWPYSMMKHYRDERKDDYDYLNWTPERFRETIEISHLSIFAFDQDSHCSYEFYNENKDVIDEMCNRLGYNFTVTSAERLGNKLAITIKNTGLAPAFFNIQLCAEITDAEGNKLENFGAPVMIEKGTFKDNTQRTFVFDYNGTLSEDATICLAMYDIDNPLVAGKDPTVRFDNKNNLSNKRLKLIEQ